MSTIDIVASKLETLLNAINNDYKIFSISHFNKNYTEARQYANGEDIGFANCYTSDYGEYRKDKIIGILTFINASRSNSNAYYLSTNYKIQFSVPRNVNKTTRTGTLISTAPFTFDSDMQSLIGSLINTKITFDSTYYGKMTMSEPTYVATETDGENYYDIMEVNGLIIITDKAKFGSDYKVEFLIDGNYVELDDITSYTETNNTDNNAIIKIGTTKIQQDLAQLSWVCAVTIDDYVSNNLARTKIFDIIHENQEIINSNGSTEAFKRKMFVRITSPYNDIHIFNAVVNIGFTTSRNGTGSYTISLIDDGKSYEQYTLSFNSDGGSTINSKVVFKGYSIGTLETPTKENYNFVGWKIDGNLITEDTKYNFSSNKTAVAEWTYVIYTGLNSTNNVTTNEDDIVAYMVGDNTTTNGNGLTSAYTTGDTFTILSEYKNKPVIKIGKYAFANKSVENILIPSSIKSIGTYAFSRASWDNSLTIPSSVTSLDFRVFNLADLTNGVTFESGIQLSSLSKAFQNSSIVSITLPNSINAILDEEFKDCTNLSTITLNSGLHQIGDYAFEGTNITQITIPSTVNYLGKGLFNNANCAMWVKMLNTSFLEGYEIDSWSKSPFLNMPSNSLISIPSSVTTPSTSYGAYWNYYDETHTLTYNNDVD